MTTYRVFCFPDASVRATSVELATKAMPAVARAMRQIEGVVESAGYTATGMSGGGSFDLAFSLETDADIVPLVGVLAGWCDSVRVFRMNPVVLLSGAVGAEGAVVADYPPVYAPGRTNFRDAWVVPACWCGDVAAVVNEATDASEAHAACPAHCKDGYVLIPDWTAV
jgi:hypothetical protein